MLNILESIRLIIAETIKTFTQIDTLKSENATLAQSLADALADDAADAAAIAEAQAAADAAKLIADESAASLVTTQEKLDAALVKLEGVPEIEAAVAELAGLFPPA